MTHEETEQYRHECEVREYAKWERHRLVEHMKRIAEKRGRAAAERLWRDVAVLRKSRASQPAD